MLPPPGPALHSGRALNLGRPLAEDPRMTEATTTAPAGWYPDPHLPATLRYFDGAQWTHHLAPMQQPAYPQPMFPAQRAPEPSGAHPSDPVHWLLPTGRTGASIAAGYVGLVALFLWAFGPIALGLGIWAWRTSGVDGKAHGRGRAVFAMIAGAFGSIAGLLFLANTSGGS